MNHKKINVVAAAIISDEKVLAMQRSEKMSLPGFWEFPGGKIESGESEQEALIREIKEELSIDIKILTYLNEHTHTYDFGAVSLRVYTAKVIAGSIKMNEHSDKKWLSPDNLASVQWAPADIPAVELLVEKLV